MSQSAVVFNARELDGFLQRWLAGGLSRAELEEWKRVLASDTQFREEFCDWIKCLRDPGWSRKGPRRIS